TKDIAGPIDMLAVFSDGSAAVYDFKTFSRSGKQEPGQIVKNKWHVQMYRYKNMIKHIYGVTTFRQKRMIPIQVNYSKKINGEYVNKNAEGFQAVDMQNKSNIQATKHLNAIPIDEPTGDENLDDLIRDLIAERNVTEELLNRARVDDKTRLLNKLSRVNKKLENLQLNRDIAGTLKDIVILVNRYKDRIHLTSEDSNYMNFKELTDAIDELSL